MKLEVLEKDKVYHIYNRGINSETIFNSDENKHYFLKLYSKYLENKADTFAYCLMDNHFHFIIRIVNEKEITDSLPVAMLRPFSSGGSRGFMIDAMKQFGPDSLTGRLSCIFQCSAETTFYVIAVYFGSINVKNTRYTLGMMLLVDLICVITAIFVASWFF